MCRYHKNSGTIEPVGEKTWPFDVPVVDDGSVVLLCVDDLALVGVGVPAASEGRGVQLDRQELV